MSRSVFVIFVALLFCLPSGAQTTERSRGSVLYQQGKYAEAAKELNSAVKSKTGKNDPDLWNQLGLAEAALGEFKKAVKAFKKASDLRNTDSVIWSNLGYAQLRLRDLDAARSSTDRAVKIDANNVFAYYVRGLAHLWEGDLDDAEKNYLEIMNRDKKYSQGYLLGSWIQLGRLNLLVSKQAETGSIRSHIGVLKNAVDILHAGLDHSDAGPAKESLRVEYEGLNYFYEHFSKEPKTPGSQSEPGVTPYKIISKPRASYTNDARYSGVSGTIRVVAMLRPDGKVGHIFVLKRLGYGLDENAVAAARAIKFEPKMKDGKPVPAVVTIDYGFNIY